MCGSLKHNAKEVFRGQVITQVDAKFQGNARVDGSRDGTKTMADQWPPSKWKVALIRCESFSEKDSLGRVHHIKAEQLAALVNKEERDCRILTRPTRNDFESSIHNRWTICLSNNWTVDRFVKYMNNKLGTNYEAMK